MVPLPLQFLAAWLGVWFARVLQQQVDYLKELRLERCIFVERSRKMCRTTVRKENIKGLEMP
jgi:hypothetical protein